VRTRAALTTLFFFCALIGGLGFIPAPDRSRAQGVVEPVDFRDVNMVIEGGIAQLDIDMHPADGKNFGMPMVKKNQLILTAENRTINVEIEELEKKYEMEFNRMHMVRRGDSKTPPNPGEAASIEKSLKKLKEAIDTQKERLERLKLLAPESGVLVADGLESRNGMAMSPPKPKEKLGVIASLDLERLLIRAWVPNELAGTIYREAKDRVEIRVMGRPDILLEGKIFYKAPSGQNRLPSAALGYSAGGATETTHDDPSGTKTVESGLEVRISNLKYLHKPDNVNDLLPGQRVVIRFEFADKPYLSQAWTSLQQLFQKKFH
jgi:putative peptide zinc metalloprotease protein